MREDAPHLRGPWRRKLTGVVVTTLPSQLRRATSPYTGEARKRSPPCVKGDVNEVDGGIVLYYTIQPFRHGFAVPPPLTQGRLEKRRPPCAKGAPAKRVGDCF